MSSRRQRSILGLDLSEVSKTYLALAVGIAVLLFVGERVVAYALNGKSWPSGTVAFQLALGNAGRTLIDGNVSWNVAAAPAFNCWNPSIQRVQFANTTGSGSASMGDGLNSIVFASSVYGQSFGSGTLAVTAYRYSGSTMIESDTLFNVNQNFDSYRGPLRYGSNQKAIGDVRRVLVHELGHSLGLAHANGDVIMNAVMSDREVPATDDINGAQALYGVRPPATLKVSLLGRDSNGDMILQCVGAPSAVNRIEASTILSPDSFSTISTVNVDNTGRFQFRDVNAGTFAQRFYRVAYP
jgi:Matrixin